MSATASQLGSRSSRLARPRDVSLTPADPQRIYSVLFPGPIPDVLARRFRDAWARLGRDYTPEECRELDRVLRSGGDLEAMELAGRLRKRVPALSAQVRLMAVLAETLPEHFDSYVNLADRPLRGYLALARAGIRTVWKFGKGLYLLGKLDVR